VVVEEVSMEQRISQRIVGYHIPNYMSEILVRDYAKTFLKMVISKDSDSYEFTYKVTNYQRLMTDKISSAQKMKLLEILYEINKANEDHLIPGEKYLLEPALIYWKNQELNRENVRILYYPDIREEPFLRKWLVIIEKILDPSVGKERELIDEIRNFLRQGNNPDRIKMLIEKRRVAQFS
jgi:hypothetical protein